MFELVPVSDRISKIRERYRETVPRIDTARYRLVTEFYQQNPQLTGILRRARCMKHIFENMPVRIDGDDLIVGALGTTYRSCAIYPEYSLGSLPEEIASGNVTNRKYDPYLINDDDAAYILETAPYWRANSFGSMMKAYTLDGLFAHNNSGTTTHNVDFPSAGPVGHFCTGYTTAIDKGFAAIRDEALAKMSELELSGMPDGTIDQYQFYRAVSLVCDGMIAFTKHYAREAERQLAECTDPVRKAELERMVECLNWVTEKPARTFYEATQALFLYEIALSLEGNLHGMSYGRVDQYLGKYYEADLAAGRITPEEGQEIVDAFMLKTAEMNKFWGDMGELGQTGYTSGQLITIGGVIPETGEDATNEVTFMLLQTLARLSLHEPIALRVHEGMSRELWEAAIVTTRVTGGIPSLESDKVIIPAMMDRGHTLESARNYCAIGCVEPGGTGNEWPACGGTGSASYWNLANALWLAINNGYNPMPIWGMDGTSGANSGEKDGKIGGQVGLPTGYLYEMEDFQEVLDAFKAQVDYFVRWHAAATNNFEYLARQIIPLPVVSATMKGCMEKGADVMFGGAEYNSTGLSGVGIGNVADSLQMIKHLCWDTKRCTTRELYDALINNWEGYEDLHSYIKTEAPHYGNGVPEVDQYAGWASKVFADAVKAQSGPRGRYAPGLYPVTSNIMFGKQTAATPDGRYAQQPLADGISPVQQMDKNGPTAILRSTTTIDHRDFGNGTLLNMKFHPSALSSADGMDKLIDLMETFFFDLDGMEMQINIVSAETLHAAQDRPKEYKDLVVRIAGFSVFFVEMTRAGQNDVISRTELAL